MLTKQQQVHWGQLAKTRRKERGLSAYRIEQLTGLAATAIYQLDKRPQPITRASQASPKLKHYADLLGLELFETLTTRSLAFRVRVYRRLHNLSPSEMADRVGLTEHDLRHAENFKRPLDPTHRIAQRLEHFFQRGERLPQLSRDPNAPKTRAQCPPMRADGSRPCPWVGCRYHCFLEVSRPSGGTKVKLRINPQMDEETLHLMPRPCTLDMAEFGAWTPSPMSKEIQDNMTFEEIGRVFGISRERVRQIEEEALRKLRKRAPWLLHLMLTSQHDDPRDTEPTIATALS